MSVKKSRALCGVVLIVLFATGVVGWAQSATEDEVAKGTQARGYWVDPATKLMWAAKDNGKDVNWHQATSYCGKLRVGGYADWRLATIDELEELIDLKAHAPEHVGDSSILHFNMSGKMPGGLLVKWRVWSSSRRMDGRGKPEDRAWYFDFINVMRSDVDEDDGLAASYELRALCVRDSGAGANGVAGGVAGSATENQNKAQEAQVAPTYSDPATGLIWAAKDNGKDVNLGEAIKYCRDLRADGSSGWRLATIGELEGMQNSKGKASDLASKQDDEASSRRGGGMLVLTGDLWSSSPVSNDMGYEPSFVWYLSSASGTRVFDDPSFSRAKRAVCVRDASAQHASQTGAAGAIAGPSNREQETQERGYWIDPATGLTWAARDGLYGSSFYSDATRYCQKLRLAGHSDWRLATLDELRSVYDPGAESPGESPRTNWVEPESVMFHVEGNLFLTGVEWIKTSENDDRSPSQYRSVFDFKDGKAVSEKRYFVEASALCVRGPG